MGKNTIVKELERAKESGFIFEFFENDFECTQECDECPASEACTQLSNHGHYDVFVTNYRTLKLFEEFSHDGKI